ncbi:glycogen debranching protein GlgX [Actinomyces sp. B33]|uniref:glycogen debranching protein GlgX n=1 Tax=Actinomyces sp. B33 TaxID=2942131 RepID=UPI002340A796|nr:glycogen debranching protein GlgX [Actinomyces sp. B33]MDC4232873.1 glycogen debranching protein GlgX [Actinomyces sp. B33]
MSQSPAGGPASTIDVTEANPVPSRLGVHLNGSGLDVAVVARWATRVDFCVLDDDGAETHYRLLGPDTGVWHGRIPSLGEGTRYGFRVHGPWDPDNGLFHNPAKLLIDPYARGLEGEVDMGPAIYAHSVDDDEYPTSYPLERSGIDSAGHVPVSVVVDSDFPIAPKPRTPWSETVIYEIHVKGFTKNMTQMPEELRGTYAGLAHPASIDYLKTLGVTAVELLPVHAKCDEPFLTERGLTNYWGYSTLGFFAPEPSYATASARERGARAVVDEFRGMVSILHEAGIEVILDVVYNHTCEGGDSGPTLSFRGLDSELYYRRTPGSPSHPIDDTGCGNTLNGDHPKAIKLVLDSLRYWSSQMGVDGFRFDLAATLGRFASGFTPLHPLLIGMATDDDLSMDKLIAEPWDIGPGGWQTGNFPAPFSEWNDQYRGSLRGFWLTDLRAMVEGGHPAGPTGLATRLSGSQDVFDHGIGRLRGPRASINFITAHDGFTLADLTAYNGKHNLANLEDNRDGSEDNRSWNHGVEGTVAATTDGPDPDLDLSPSGLNETEIAALRARTRRNILTTLMVSAGTPMLLGGDEFGRTQYGNNNAYCQDSPISWVDWDLAADQRDSIAFVSWLIALRRAHPVLRPVDFATGEPTLSDTIADLSWYTADGSGMPEDGWHDPAHRVFQMLRSGVPAGDHDALVVINATLDDQEVRLPAGHGLDWLVAVDTAWSSPADGGILPDTDPRRLGEGLRRVPTGSVLGVEAHSMLVLLSDIPTRALD